MHLRPVAWMSSLPRTLVLCLAMVGGVAARAQPACAPWVEEQGEGLRLRPHTDAFMRCGIDERTYATLLQGWFERHPSPPAPRWIALGRAVDYPWLSRALALAAWCNVRVHDAQQWSPRR